MEKLEESIVLNNGTTFTHKKELIKDGITTVIVVYVMRNIKQISQILIQGIKNVFLR